MAETEAKIEELFLEKKVPDLSFAQILEIARVQGILPGQTLQSPIIYGGQIIGAQYRAAEGKATLEVFPEEDKEVAIVIKDDTGTVVFQAWIDGDNVGDVIFGDFDGGSGLKWDKSASSFLGSNINILRTLTAGQSIAAGDATFVSDGVNGSRVGSFTQTTTASGSQAMGTNAKEQIAFKITTSNKLYVKGVTIDEIGKNNSPSDDVEVALQGDSSGSPDGSDVAVTAAVDVQASASYTFNFSSIQTLSASTDYWFVIRRTGSLHDSNYYLVSTGGVSGIYQDLDDGVWDGVTGWGYDVLELPPAGTLGKASADVSGRYESFIGFAQEAIDVDASGKVFVSGVVTGLTGLTAGSTYYLSDTAGEISTSAGSNTRKVGIALSTTTLLITNIW